MQRRKFIRTAGVGAAGVAAASTVAAPAIAQSMPEVKWRLTSSFPKSLDTLYGGSRAVRQDASARCPTTSSRSASSPPAKSCPGLQVADAVQNGTVEAGQTAAYYYFGKHPNFVFETGLPFAHEPAPVLCLAEFGGGHELINEFYKEYNFRSFTFGGTGCQMGGWFRKEIKSMDDMKGLKFRVGGFAGLILQRLGVVPQQIAGGDIYPALEKGTIDACEWVGPYDDEKLGFNKVAKYYYYPGWWEGALGRLALHQQRAWAKLPKPYQAMVEAAAGRVTSWMVPKYDAGNPAALRRLVAAGTELRPFPRAVLEPCFIEAYKYYDELSAKDPKFKKIYDNLKAFRADENLWFRVAENTFDNFNFSMSAQGR